ncbi:MAG: isochorismatase family protein [Spirochaetaceae bacterium]|jgi:nicotinamidase/pyrazinamidase|nr:isochorismatase family protein [Spirochaetaceae bacterium]
MKKALLVVDMQNDFIDQPGAALAVPGAAAIISRINSLAHSGEYDLVLACQDWHPANHRSFYTEWAGKKPFDTVEMPYGTQALWPVHTVQGTWGAEFHAEIDQRPFRFIVRKGTNPGIDSYSAFFENDRTTPTGLGQLIAPDTQLDCCGVATDFCLGASALDAARFCRTVRVLLPAAAGIQSESTAAMLDRLKEAGVTIAA